MLSIMSDTRQAGLQQREHCVVAKSDVSVLVLGRFRRRRCHVQGKRSVCCVCFCVVAVRADVHG